jgi:hypothetical protein
MKAIIMALTAVALGSTGFAVAGERDPGVNRHQLNQQARIHQGVKSGQLTGQEARHLERKERNIRQEERVDKADGRLSPSERADLHRDLRAANRDIYRQKHDGQTR